MPTNVPGLAEDRMKWSYHEIFMYTLIWNVALATICVASLWLLLLVLKWRLIIVRRANANTDNKQSLVTSENLGELPTNNQQQRLLTSSNPAPPIPLWMTIIDKLVSILFYMLLLTVALIFLSSYMFGQLGVGIDIDIIAIVIMTLIVALPTFVWKLLTRTRSHQQMKWQYIITGALLVLWLGLSIMGVIMTRRACLCAYNDRYGVTVTQDFQLSTEFTRASRGKICKDNSICHVYATLPEDTDTSVFINIQTGTDVINMKVDMIEAAIVGEQQQVGASQAATKFAVGQTLETNGKRNLFSTLFSNLKPETDYIVKITGGNGIFLTTRYRTLPAFDSNSELRVAFGGDVGMSKLGSDITLLLASYDPHALIIGGDISYDDAMPSCYYSWDNFYQIFEGLNNKLNRLVPMILTIGNHDVGFDSMATVEVKPDKEGPFFFAFHPQHYQNVTSKSGVPAIINRCSYHYHRMGKVLMVNLDSGYIFNFTEQKQFIEEVSKANPKYQKISNYHNPIYPTCSDRSDTFAMRVLNESRTHWVPLLQNYKFIASMEHHTHHLKYTFPITNGQRDDQNGIVYIGDGCWGVTNQPCPHNFRVTDDMFDQFDNDNSEHVWMMYVKDAKIKFVALDSTGNTRMQNVRTFRS